MKLLLPFFNFIKKNRLYESNTKHRFPYTHDEIFEKVYEIFMLNKVANEKLKLLNTWLTVIELE